MINTVTGPIKKEELGATLSHEHLTWDSTDAEKMYFEKEYDTAKVEDGFNKLLPVLEKLYRSGCRAFAEASPPKGGQNLLLMQKLSKASGIKIIPNTGMVYQDYDEASKFNTKDFEEVLAQQWIKDYDQGLDTIDGVVIRPSHIKIFDTNGSLTEGDVKVLKAAMKTSNVTGIPIHCHILRECDVEKIIDLLDKEDFDFSKFLWAHVGYDDKFDLVDEAVAKGIWLGFDIIQPKNYDKYLSMIKNAIEKGYEDKILLSQDYDFLEEATKSGENHPCASLFTDFIPYCYENGIPKETIMKILTNNPANFYDV